MTDANGNPLPQEIIGEVPQGQQPAQGENGQVAAAQQSCGACIEENWDSFAAKIDMFPAPIPQFTLDGAGAIPSTIGVIVSCLIYFVVLTQWVPTIIENLIYKANPGLLDITSDGVYGKEEPIELIGMKKGEFPGGSTIEKAKKRRVNTAFRVVNFQTQTELDDNLNYWVKWEAYYVKSDGIPNNDQRTKLPVHRCNKADVEDFYEPRKSHKKKIDTILKQGAWCLDEAGRPPLELWGDSENQEHQRVEFQLVPKQSKYVWDALCTDPQEPLPCAEQKQQLQDAYDYMGNPSMEIIINTEELNEEDFSNQGRTRRESIVLSKQFRADIPAFVNGLISLVQLDDETSNLKKGLPNTTYFHKVKLGALEPSGRTQYPNNYRFIALQLFMSGDKTVVVRSTDDLNDAMGKWGGIIGFFSFFGSWIATRFGEYNIFRKLAVALFEENPHREHNGTPLVLPWTFNFRKYMLDTFGCCCKRLVRGAVYNEEMSKTNGIQDQLDRQLDIVHFIRRMRMYSLGLMVEMDDRELEINHRLGYKRDVAAINIEWEAENGQNADCSICGDGGVTAWCNSLIGNTPQVVPPNRDNLVNEDLTETEAAFVNEIRETFHGKQPLTQIWNRQTASFHELAQLQGQQQSVHTLFQQPMVYDCYGYAWTQPQQMLQPRSLNMGGQYYSKKKPKEDDDEEVFQDKDGGENDFTEDTSGIKRMGTNHKIKSKLSAVNDQEDPDYSTTKKELLDGDDDENRI